MSVKLGYCSDCQPMERVYHMTFMHRPWMRPKWVTEVSTDWGTHELCISCQAARGVSDSLFLRLLDWFFPMLLPPL